MPAQKKTLLGLIAFVGFGLLFQMLFQNCGGGFTSMDYALSPGSAGAQGSDTTPQGGQPPAPPPSAGPGGPAILFANTIKELQGITVRIGGVEALTFPDGLPRGAVYDGAARRINWIPQKGQAGGYRFRVFEAGKEKGLIDFQVQKIAEQVLLNGGPPFLYGDGDVGYIFVHGAGDVDRCADRANLADYWGQGPQTVAPDAANRTIVCYDSRKAVASVARDVSNQILNAKCGKFNRCIVITHSMGGLLMEHIFLHIREALPTDPEPAMYNNRALYNQVKERTLLVISLASAAGGSKAASIVNRDGTSVIQSVVGTMSAFMGLNDDSTRNLVSNYASKVVAPFAEDPGVPFFMVGGFTDKTLAEVSILGSIFGIISVPRSVFGGNREFAILDTSVLFRARSDGLVDFRSACGIASPSDDDGVGRSVGLEDHFHYCWSSRKKSNHYVWFLTNMNHAVITGIPYDCRDSEYPCNARFPDETRGSFTINPTMTGLRASEVIRRRLAGPPLVPN
jgi:hypothetical protein